MKLEYKQAFVLFYNTAALLISVDCSSVSLTDYLEQREELMAIGGLLFTGFTEEEEVVDRYLGYLREKEVMKTEESGFPPARPLEGVLETIRQSPLYNILKKMPKGANLRSNEDYLLSRRKFLDIVWDSDDFKYLYIQPETHPTAAWSMDFFIEPPEGDWWQKVQGDNRYTKELVLKKQVLIDVLDDKAKEYQTDTGDRSYPLTHILYRRGVHLLLQNYAIKQAYLKEMYNDALQHGVIHLETRLPVDRNRKLYVLDSDEAYSATYGKRYLKDDADFRLAKDVIEKVKEEQAAFSGHLRILGLNREASDLSDISSNVTEWKGSWGDQVVGADLIGVEDDGYSILYHAKSLLALDVPLYLEAGVTNWYPGVNPEGEGSVGGPGEDIYDAILLGPKRIGGGLSLNTHPNLLLQLNKTGTAVEICPARDQLLGYVPDMRNHPAIAYFRFGLPVVLASCDAGIMGTDFSIDWYLALVGWGLTLGEVKELAENSIKHSAMTSDRKQHAFEQIWRPQWHKFISDMKAEACKVDLKTSFPVLQHVIPKSVPAGSTSGIQVYGKHFERGICEKIVCRFGEVRSESARFVTSNHLVCAAPKNYKGNASEPVSIQVSFDGGNNFVDGGLHITFSVKGNGNRILAHPVMVVFIVVSVIRVLKN